MIGDDQDVQDEQMHENPSSGQGEEIGDEAPVPIENEPEEVGETVREEEEEVAKEEEKEEEEEERTEDRNESLKSSEGGGATGEEAEEEAEERAPEPMEEGEKEKTPVEEEEEMERNENEQKEREEDESPLEPTLLGIAIDSLMMNWCQLLSTVTVKAPVPPCPTPDHVKEVAEVCSKHFRDSSVDVTNEFSRLGVQWEMEQASEQFMIEEADLDDVIARQKVLIETVTEALEIRVARYREQFPDAGKHFTT
ncbi:unnamed protein product [Caenorhabditis sp. 36 PRJEB53466]|nr:unnamed protein product [Caenorhabditis sp. 36 PRJEB53466]